MLGRRSGTLCPSRGTRRGRGARTHSRPCHRRPGWGCGETAELTLMKNGSGWLCSSSSPRTVTGPPLVTLPPTKTCRDQSSGWPGQRGGGRPRPSPGDGERRRGAPGSRRPPHLPHQLGPAGVGDVVLADVSVQPVAEVQEPVVQRDEDVGDEALGRVRQSCTRGGGTGSARGSRGAPRHPARGNTDLASPGAATPPPSCWGPGSPSRPPSLLAAEVRDRARPRGAQCVGHGQDKARRGCCVRTSTTSCLRPRLSCLAGRLGLCAARGETGSGPGGRAGGAKNLSNFPARLAGLVKDVLSPHPVRRHAQQQTPRRTELL